MVPTIKLIDKDFDCLLYPVKVHVERKIKGKMCHYNRLRLYLVSPDDWADCCCELEPDFSG